MGWQSSLPECWSIMLQWDKEGSSAARLLSLSQVAQSSGVGDIAGVDELSVCDGVGSEVGMSS